MGTPQRREAYMMDDGSQITMLLWIRCVHERCVGDDTTHGLGALLKDGVILQVLVYKKPLIRDRERRSYSPQ